MYYPNGNYRLAQLIKDFESGDFDIYLEKNEKPGGRQLLHPR